MWGGRGVSARGLLCRPLSAGRGGVRGRWSRGLLPSEGLLRAAATGVAQVGLWE